MLSGKCFEHFFESRTSNELAAFKLVAKISQESNLKGTGIFISNITVITLNKFGKRARGCCVHVFLVISIVVSILQGCPWSMSYLFKSLSLVEKYIHYPINFFKTVWLPNGKFLIPTYLVCWDCKQLLVCSLLVFLASSLD